MKAQETDLSDISEEQIKGIYNESLVGPEFGAAGSAREDTPRCLIAIKRSRQS